MSVPCATFKKLQFTFLGPGFIQRCAGQLEDELCSLKYMEDSRTATSRPTLLVAEKIFQQIQNLKANGYTGIDSSTSVCFFLSGIDKPSLKTPVQVCKSQASYSFDFHECASYLASMVQKTSVTEQVQIAATAAAVDVVKLEKRSGTYCRLPHAKYPDTSTSYYLLSRWSGSG